MQYPTFENRFAFKLKKAVKFALEQLGYHCRDQAAPRTFNTTALISVIAGVGAFCLSLGSVNEVSFVALLKNACSVILALGPTWLSHYSAIKKHNENLCSSAIPVPTVASRTPHGSTFLLYLVLAIYGFLALVYRLLFGGEFAIWIINFTVLFIESIGILIDICVIVFDAEIKID